MNPLAKFRSRLAQSLDWRVQQASSIHQQSTAQLESSINGLRGSMTKMGASLSDQDRALTDLVESIDRRLKVLEALQNGQ